MALPQQVIDRLSKDPAETPGWSYGMLLFGGGVFAITILIYFGLTLGYGPYLDGQIQAQNRQIQTVAQSISVSDQNQLVTFYSEIANIKTTLANHIFFSSFLAWLEKNTEANMTFTHLGFSSGNQISLTGLAPSMADVDQQLAIFQASPAVKNFSISNVTLTGSNEWQFNAALTVDPAAVLGPQTQ